MSKRRVLGPTELGLRDLVGQYAWDVSYDRTLNLSMEFGEPTLKVFHEPVAEDPRPSTRPASRYDLSSKRLVTARGRWWLWIYCSYWKLAIPDRVAVTTSSAGRDKAPPLFALDGQRLTGLEVDVRTGASRFTFDLGAELRCRRFEAASTDELWCLHLPDECALSVRGDGTFDHVPAAGDDPRPRIERRPLASLLDGGSVNVPWSSLG